MSINRQIITTLGGTLCLAPLLALASSTAPLPVPQSTVQEQPLLLAFGGGSGSRPGRMGRGGPGYGAGPGSRRGSG